MHGLLRLLDVYQRSRPWLAFPVAVGKRFADDRAGRLAALIAYQGLFSLFPLLLMMVSVLGLVLRSRPELQASVVGSVLAQFPIIGDQIARNVGALSGEGAGVTLGFGTVTALWAGLGVTRAAQNALNDVWGVQDGERPKLFASLGRGLVMLAVLGTLTVVSTVASALSPIALPVQLGLNVATFLLAYIVLTDVDLPWRRAIAGAVSAAAAWTVIQAAGTFYVAHMLRESTAVYGFFGFVLALLTWMFLGAQVFLLGAEVNVVRAHHLWPRNLVRVEVPGGTQPPAAVRRTRVTGVG